MAAGGASLKDAVKVVFINTQYVETDATSFKSVVQRLTGKDAKIEGDCDYPPHAAAPGRSRPRNLLQPGGAPVLSRGFSSKDFDRWMKELPPFEDLYRLYVD